MFAKKIKLADFRDDYATCADFCDVFESNEKQFYLLAYLLTADDQEAEACVVAAIEESCSERNVFRGWEKVWSKRCIIIKALNAIASRQLRFDQNLPLQGSGSRLQELEFGTMLRGVVRLEPAERVVFVANVLEHYSLQECSLLLGRSPESVKDLKLQAIGHLSEFAAEHISYAELPATKTGRMWAAAPQPRKRWRSRYLDSPCFASIWLESRSLRSA